MKENMKLNMILASKIMFFIVVTSLLLLVVVGCNDKKEINLGESQNASDHQNAQDSEPSKKITTIVFQNVNLITMTDDKVSFIKKSPRGH